MAKMCNCTCTFSYNEWQQPFRLAIESFQSRIVYNILCMSVDNENAITALTPIARTYAYSAKRAELWKVKTETNQMLPTVEAQSQS